MIMRHDDDKTRRASEAMIIRHDDHETRADDDAQHDANEHGQRHACTFTPIASRYAAYI